MRIGPPALEEIASHTWNEPHFFNWYICENTHNQIYILVDANLKLKLDDEKKITDYEVVKATVRA